MMEKTAKTLCDLAVKFGWDEESHVQDFVLKFRRQALAPAAGKEKTENECF
jgi:hypothetical protein